MGEVGCLKDGHFKNLQVEGNSVIVAGGMVIAGIELVPNDIATTALGLNPTWIQNFGGAVKAAATHTTDSHMLDVLTPTNTLFRMSLALKKVASQGSVVTAAQAGQIFGLTSTEGAVIDMTGVSATDTNWIPAKFKVNTITGITTANLTLDNSATDLESDQDMAMILFNDYTIEAGHFVTIGMHGNNEHLRASTEFVCSGAGTDVMTRQGATTDQHQDIKLTASGDTKILAGSYIYLNAGADTDELTIKGCILSTGGSIGVSYAN